MTNFPTASVVSRALRRDVGIVTVDTGQRNGYSVHKGSSYMGPSIWVSVSDAEATNVRHARKLAEELREVYGWVIDLEEGSSILYATHVSTMVEAARAYAAYEVAEAQIVLDQAKVRLAALA